MLRRGGKMRLLLMMALMPICIGNECMEAVQETCQEIIIENNELSQKIFEVRDNPDHINRTKTHFFFRSIFVQKFNFEPNFTFILIWTFFRQIWKIFSNVLLLFRIFNFSKIYFYKSRGLEQWVFLVTKDATPQLLFSLLLCRLLNIEEITKWLNSSWFLLQFVQQQ